MLARAVSSARMRTAALTAKSLFYMTGKRLVLFCFSLVTFPRCLYAEFLLSLKRKSNQREREKK